MTSSYEYAAFISYSHRDKAFGERLHRALERYAVPKRLQGVEGRDGPIPARIFPVFRDREELPSSADLNDQITAALEASATLVVVCSPRAAASRWVNEEILAFKRLGRAGRILAVIIDGEPNVSDKPDAAGAEECFPEALRFRVGPDGALTSERVEPVAADARPEGDGEENARLKVIAGVLGVGFDQLKQRDLEAQRNRLRKLVAISATAAIAFAALLALAVYFARQARAERGRALLHLGDSYAGNARDLATEGRQDAATRVALMGLRMSEGASTLAADVLRYAGGTISLRARFPLNTQVNSRAELAPDEQRLVTPLGNDAVIWDPARGTPVLRLQGHTGLVRTAQFSPDGARVLTASEDGTARVWDARDGRAIGSLGSGEPLMWRQMWFARFWRGGDAIVTATSTGDVRVWDVRERRQIASMNIQSAAGALVEGGVSPEMLSVMGGVETLDISSDGRKILVLARMGAPILYVFDEAGNISLTLLPARSTTAAELSPDSRYAVTASRVSGVSIWDAQTGQGVRTLQPPAIRAVVRFSPDSRILAVTDGGTTINLWEVDSGTRLRSLQASSPVSTIAFSADGKRVGAGGADGPVDVWSVADGQAVVSLSGHVGRVAALQFAGGARTLYSSSSDGSVRMWSLEHAGPRTLKSIPVKNGYQATIARAGGRTFVADEGVLTSIDDGSFSVRKERGVPAEIPGMSVAHKGDRIAAVDAQDGAVVYDVATGSVTRMGQGQFAEVGPPVWAPDDASLAVPDAEGGVVIFDSKTGRVIRHIKRTAGERVDEVKYSRDGSKLLMGDRDSKLEAWTPEGKRLFGIGDASARHVVFAVSPVTDDVITGGLDIDVRIWDGNTGALKTTLAGHGRGPLGGQMLAVGFSDDGRYAFSRSMDNTVRLWDVRTGAQLRSLSVYGDDETACVAFMPGSKEVVVAGLDGQRHGQVIEIATGQVTLALPGLRGCAVFSADRMTAAGKTYGAASIWDTSRLTMSVDELVAAACVQGHLPLTARTFLQAEGDRDQMIHNLRLDASGKEIDVCTGEPAPTQPVAASPSQGAVEKFNEGPALYQEMADTWMKQTVEVDALFKQGKPAEARALAEKTLATSREAIHWHGSSFQTRRMLVHALVVQAGVLMDLARYDAARQILNEAVAMFDVIERFGELDEATEAIRRRAFAALAEIQGR